MKEFGAMTYVTAVPTSPAAYRGPLTTVGHSGSRTAHLAAKRALDIAVSFTALAILLPFFVLVCIAIRLESKGSPIFSQVRWGVNCTRIRIYKFRSMRTDLCDASGIAQTTKNDPRITRLGAILRKTSIDELPQLVNVLLGHMSLVGPRCHAVGMLAADRLYEDLVPHYHDRHRIKPGLTGLAQVRGLRGPTTDAAKARARIACDIYYMHNYSFWMDMSIIGRTVMSELRGGSGF
ncbi:lipopolysaccharide/colanic/teichoic acid biosynthesis glycosyltransferase [Rhizobium sp. PP-F2F-G38]|uniref:Sugar transferase n=2 Tax=Hyphomicrobiales TaxID=356 RepID=A0AA44CAZ9_9HYPH|nr:sugar transferase [Ferranicluibacter rubi]PYE35916.1 lipopolysaccharide/colanic/teichoic acid biosynthesis glycosyltransferase [Rhizobium sp. PP-WC-1G-195]PYE99411.1 lipopolysaccharide/colanic/teichoic acid biosynthesis glycosyltransferase [Rhizobium sp. PP-F2F-G38]TCQ12399.1 lipopolysaccharide/colanic/teichoic acid biosynthesis glycosyltransferase [Rhizobium sp. PP-F2F-G36]TCQ28838.1 lipopolysaccharide/colanic/teichoic acid biosynthesis glycosyltransferase [Rhizobium sp. PP-CC-3G-465]NHT74